MTIVRFVARPMLAATFVASGVDRLRNVQDTANQLQPALRQVQTMVPSAAPVTGNEKLVAQVIGATQVGAGVLLGIGKFPRIAALLLAGTAAANALVEFNAADATSPESRRTRRNQLLKNVSLIGGVLLAAVDTNGRPGLVWRAEHLASDARRNVQSFGKDARKNASTLSKDARKQLQKAERTVRAAASDVVGS